MWNIEPNEPALSSAALGEGLRHRSPEGAAVLALSQSCIGQGWEFQGQIAGAESLYIDGCMEGTISLPNGLLTLGPNSRVHAEVTVRDMVVRGRIEGRIVVANRLDIRCGAVVMGNMAASRLSIEEGAHIQGRANTAGELAVRASLHAPSPVRPGGRALEGAKVTRIGPRAAPIPA